VTRLRKLCHDGELQGDSVGRVAGGKIVRKLHYLHGVTANIPRPRLQDEQ